MKYIINELIEFNTDDGTLYLPASNDVIKLALPAARLLETFLSSEGRELTREFLLETVWDRHGLHASGSNLNQYISILRRNLALLGCKDLIITLPKVGFILNSDINIRSEETEPVSPPDAVAKKATRLNWQPLLMAFGILVLLTGALAGWYAHLGATNGMTTLVKPGDNCEIIYLKEIADSQKQETLVRIENALNRNKMRCEKNSLIIYGNEVSSSEKDNTRELLSYCYTGESREIISCDNFYHYKWNKKQ
ncbi:MULTISPECIES: winged helix-turn-helix domain-containing protein [Enterobacteriaceae]|jgi:DNA-binding winged helix-turn-helix (wHTH) protein|uniref:winged helix-turn-helix domain-containing protein n=1 Tax=Enterobacteriaceae TaxID=543 RepID=UPI001E404DF4|nr:winged helix-turn-helix domain-containing protein [Lelliottia sp. WAP21]